MPLLCGAKKWPRNAVRENSLGLQAKLRHARAISVATFRSRYRQFLSDEKDETSFLHFKSKVESIILKYWTRYRCEVEVSLLLSHSTIDISSPFSVPDDTGKAVARVMLSRPNFE